MKSMHGSEKLVKDVRTLVADAEEYVKATATQSAEKVAAVKPRLEESLRTARERVLEAERHAAVRAEAAAGEGVRLVQENPWRAIGAAAAVGAVIGLLIGRR